MSRPNARVPIQQQSLRRQPGWPSTRTWPWFWLVVSSLLLALPGQAHQVKLDADVGGTLHIEPNDIPQAGADSRIWFALTRKGGDVVPLSDCDCRFTVYADTYREGEAPIAEPPLQAMSAEGYNAIPGADYIFPDVGSYTLMIAGSPTNTADFAPFELAFEVTVTARAAEPVGASDPALKPDSLAASPQPVDNPADTAMANAVAANQDPAAIRATRQRLLLLTSTVIFLAVGLSLWGVQRMRRQ
jgi:hypothetical protein